MRMRSSSPRSDPICVFASSQSLCRWPSSSLRSSAAFASCSRCASTARSSRLSLPLLCSLAASAIRSDSAAPCRPLGVSSTSSAPSSALATGRPSILCAKIRRSICSEWTISVSSLELEAASCRSSAICLSMASRSLTSCASLSLSLKTLSLSCAFSSAAAATAALSLATFLRSSSSRRSSALALATSVSHPSSETLPGSELSFSSFSASSSSKERSSSRTATNVADGGALFGTKNAAIPMLYRLCSSRSSAASLPAKFLRIVGRFCSFSGFTVT
mmetsp:Transcript_16516/g.62824  ORF Transcript_16516/g.62824 Transcript_16516/m.62824 type:complete len:275 (-) Transcript_16516:236-1060(-)